MTKRIEELREILGGTVEAGTPETPTPIEGVRSVLGPNPESSLHLLDERWIQQIDDDEFTIVLADAKKAQNRQRIGFVAAAPR